SCESPLERLAAGDPAGDLGRGMQRPVRRLDERRGPPLDRPWRRRLPERRLIGRQYDARAPEGVAGGQDLGTASGAPQIASRPLRRRAGGAGDAGDRFARGETRERLRFLRRAAREVATQGPDERNEAAA